MTTRRKRTAKSAVIESLKNQDCELLKGLMKEC